MSEIEKYTLKIQIVDYEFVVDMIEKYPIKIVHETLVEQLKKYKKELKNV